MATTLDGPVGVVKPGSWWRTQKVTNHTGDQDKLIRLIAKIPVAKGGQKENWATVPLTGGEGVCAGPLADAIWTFQQFWKANGVFHNIDGVVDPANNTLRKMDELAEERSRSGTEVMDRAFEESRRSLREALRI